MGLSLDSSRPMMAPSLLSSNRDSQRLSTYSMTPSEASSGSNTIINPEIVKISQKLQKLENKKLQSQRFEPTADKTDLLRTLALGAKLERALDRRMGGQDAVMRVKSVGVKSVAVKKDETVVPEKTAVAA